MSEVAVAKKVDSTNFDEESLQLAFKRCERDRKDYVETNRHLIDRSLLVAGFCVTVTSALLAGVDSFASSITLACCVLLAFSSVWFFACVTACLQVSDTMIPTPGWKSLWSTVVIQPYSKAMITVIQDEEKALSDEQRVNAKRAASLRNVTIAMFVQVTIAMLVLISSKSFPTETPSEVVDTKATVSQKP